MAVDEESDPEKKPLAKHVFAMESALNDLHGALELLSLAPPSPFDLSIAGNAVARATAHVCRAFDDNHDPLGAVRAAVVDLDEARLALAKAPEPHPAAGVPAELDKARGWLVVAEERHARIKPSPAMALPPISGTLGTLALHTVERAAITPVAKVPKPKAPPAAPPPAVPEKPKTIAELKARVEALKEGAKKKRTEVAERLANAKEKQKKKPDDEAPEIPPGFTKAPGAALTQKQFVEARARDLFEEVTMLGIQRLPLLGDSWRVMAEFDRRMFAAIDAIVAFGPDAIAHVERLVMDAPAKDPSRAFAIAVILGSVSGRDGLAAITRAFTFLGCDEPGVQQSLASALKLVPHPDLVPMLRFWLEDSRPAFRAVATEVLAFRAALTDDELAKAARDPSPVVRRVALRPMALLQSPLLREACDEALASEDLALAEAAFSALALGGVPNARATLLKELSGPRAEAAALPLALVARAEESEALIARLADKPTPALANAVGWAGDPRAFPALLALLRKRDEELKLGAAFALERITGANLVENTAVEPEALDAPEGEDPADPFALVGPPDKRRESLAREVSHPRDLPAEPSPEMVDLPTTSVRRWSAWLAREGKRFETKVPLRFRRGRPFTPNAVLDELRDAGPLGSALAGERRTSFAELVISTGDMVAFDPIQFVQDQDAALKAWQPIADKASSVPGTWDKPMRKRR